MITEWPVFPSFITTMTCMAGVMWRLLFRMGSIAVFDGVFPFAAVFSLERGFRPASFIPPLPSGIMNHMIPVYCK